MLSKKISFLLLTTFLTTITLSTDALAKNDTKAPQKEIYLQKDTRCRYRKKDKRTYCLNKENKRITGEIRGYQDGEIIRLIPVKNGLVHGKIVAKYTNGNMQYTKEYKEGIQDGLHETYYDNNQLSTSIPYKNGVKEGVAKFYHENGFLHIQCIYTENKMDGNARTYDTKGNLLFDIITANDKVVTGTCNYLDENNKIKSKDIPNIFIEAVNAHCVAFGTELMKNNCSLDKKDKLENCNKKWLKDNIQSLREFVSIYEETKDE